MNHFEEITTKEIADNPFHMIGQKWMLITAEKEGQVNTMTASWGGLGVMWGKDVAYVVIRPQRFTKEFVDTSETFSLSFFDEKDKAKLAYCGKVSGRDEDKITKAGLTVCTYDDTPYFDEAKTVLICKKLYEQELKKDGFDMPDLYDRWYPEDDLHTLYIAEIQAVLNR